MAALRGDGRGVLLTAGLVLQGNPGCGNAMAPIGVNRTLNIPRKTGDPPRGLCTLVMGVGAEMALGKAFQDQQYQLEASHTVLTVKCHPGPSRATRKTRTEKEATASAQKNTVAGPLLTSVVLSFHQHSCSLATVAIPPFKK